MKRYYVFLLINLIFFQLKAISPFVHPGIDQTRADMEYMKAQIQKGEQPWKDACERLKAVTNLDFEIKPYTHVLRGPYGKPNIGGDDLSKGANMAYNCALMWYITGEKAYAQKAIQVLNAWSPVLWDFDYNDAKLLAGWTGHVLCNAAEILRYTDSGWQKDDIARFTEMLMTVYYPLLRFYFPQANGNWDGAIIHSILSIAIFTDNREMFDNGIDHFLHGSVNGSIFKYVYPSGQCQESMRDQGHVQLGLGEFAGAAKIAYTQGVDLFSIADNRIALGYEYTAQYLMGKMPHCYGKISERAKDLRDDYEYVYRHYTAKGVDMPYTRMAADSVRAKANRSVLTAFRAPQGQVAKERVTLKASSVAYPAGAMDDAVSAMSADAIRVQPGQSLQDALNIAAGKNKQVVALAGIHKLSETLKIPSGVTLRGEGLKTVLFLDPVAGVRDAIVNLDNDLHDVCICDLVVEGSTDTDPGTDPNGRRSFRSTANRGAIMFLGQQEGQMKNIVLKNITVQNCTYNGVFIAGADNVSVICCNLSENGGSVVPGPKLQHNLLLSHCTSVRVKDSRCDTSPHGCGIALAGCNGVEVTGCEIARNAHYGLLISESCMVTVTGNLVEGNDRSGVMSEYLYRGSESVLISRNLVQYNGGFGVEAYAATNLKSQQNQFVGNGNSADQEKISSEKYIVME